MNKYLNFTFNKLLNFISPVIKPWEKKYIKKYAKMKLKHQPVFIIGAPRTGSTILYQTITNQLDLLYIDNLSCRFNKNLFFGFWLSNKIFNNLAHNCFKSKHGDTATCGNHAPSECGNFWYRWLSKENHFIQEEQITEKMVKEITEEITAVTNYFNKPVLFKNLNAGQRLRLLKKCFPEAKFIFVKRDPLFTAQSILKAKRKIKIADNTFWSVKPKNYKELGKLETYEQIVKQIYFIEKQIINDIKLFPQENILTIDYKDLGERFDGTIKKCQELINVKEKKSFNKAEVNLTEKLSLDKKEIEQFTFEIKKLDWMEYNDQ